jgi:hypothetical protein
MERMPRSLEKFVLHQFDIRSTDHDPHIKALHFQTAGGDQMAIATRQQLLQIADACRKAAEAMPKPS